MTPPGRCASQPPDLSPKLLCKIYRFGFLEKQLPGGASGSGKSQPPPRKKQKSEEIREEEVIAPALGVHEKDPEWLVQAEKIVKNGKLSVDRAVKAISFAAQGVSPCVFAAGMYRLLEDDRDIEEERVFKILEELRNVGRLA